MPTQSSTAAAQVERYARLAVVGAGAWGTALAAVAAAGGAQVTLWAREPEVVESLTVARENTLFLPGVTVPRSIQPTSDIASAGRADAVLVAAPAQYLRSVLDQLAAVLKPGTPLVLCAKGIELETGLLPPEILAGVLPAAEPAMLSGPSFARDVARGLPTAVTIAAREGIAARLAATFSRPSFRPYLSEDVIGVALGGAAKNVYAIACGMVDGAGFGESARAALISRSFAELLRLGAALSVKPETLMGLSGLGDLVLTATSPISRNFALGAALGKGASLGAVSGAGKPLAEGAATAPALIARARRHGVELPIAEAVADVLAGRLRFTEAAERLLARPLGKE
jgi:glycerol-3-phosphate dehydrogenase (NAD(P)+)